MITHRASKSVYYTTKQ